MLYKLIFFSDGGLAEQIQWLAQPYSGIWHSI